MVVPEVAIRQAAVLVIVLLAFSLLGCMTNRKGSETAPRDWGVSVSPADGCASLAGTYAATGEGSGSNPNDWLKLFGWPSEGQLQSLIAKGTNEKNDDSVRRLSLRILLNGNVAFSLVGEHAEPTEFHTAKPAFTCENGSLHARWSSDTGGGLWAHYSANLWLTLGSDRQLVAHNQIEYLSIQVAVVVPLRDRETVDLYFRFPQAGDHH